jgi:hypothetical protein
MSIGWSTASTSALVVATAGIDFDVGVVLRQRRQTFDAANSLWSQQDFPCLMKMRDTIAVFYHTKLVCCVEHKIEQGSIIVMYDPEQEKNCFRRYRCCRPELVHSLCRASVLLLCCYAAMCCNSEEMIKRFTNHSLYLNTVFKPLKHGYTCRREFKKHCGKELRTQI